MSIHRGWCWRLVVIALLGGLTACAMIQEPSPAPSAGTVRRPRPAKAEEPQAPGFFSPLLALGGESELYLMWASGVLNRKQNDVHLSRSVDDGLTWEPFRSLKADPARNTGGRQLVADPDGTIIGFWGAGLRTGNQEVVVTRSADRGQNWTPVSSLYKGEIHPPWLVSSTNGHLYAVIPEGPEGNWRLAFLRSPDRGRTWEPLPTLMGVHGMASRFGIRSAGVVADNQGRLHVVWQEQGGKNNERIFYSRLEPATPQSAWLPQAVQLSEGLGVSPGAYYPEISLDARGRLLVVWTQRWKPPTLSEGQYPQAVYFTKSADGGRTWLPKPIHLSFTGPEASKHIATRAVVTGDGQGRIYVAWREEVGNPRVERLLFQRSSDDGATWAPEPRIMYARKPWPAITEKFELRSGPDGHVYLLWQMAGFAWSLLFLHSDDGGATWPEVPTSLATLSQADPGIHDVAFETRGSILYVAWDVGPKLPSEIFLKRSTDFGRTWPTQEVQVTKREP